MSDVSREYYQSLFSEITEEDFNRYLVRAETKLAAVTHNRAEDFLKDYSAKEQVTPFQKSVYEQIKQTICELIHSMQEQDLTGMGSGIASVSNDGYSESYRIVTAAEKEAQLCSIVRSGLSGTGLAGAL